MALVARLLRDVRAAYTEAELCDQYIYTNKDQTDGFWEHRDFDPAWMNWSVYSEVERYCFGEYLTNTVGADEHGWCPCHTKERCVHSGCDYTSDRWSLNKHISHDIRYRDASKAFRQIEANLAKCLSALVECFFRLEQLQLFTAKIS